MPTAPEVSFPRWLSIEQAASYLGVSIQTVRNALHRGDFKASQLGPERGPYLIDRLDIDNFLARKKRVVRPYRRGTHPWVAERWAQQRARRRRAA